MRRDQFIIQTFKIVDSLFKKEGLDSCLLLYNIMPFTKNDGIVEMIQNAETLQDIVRIHGSIESYLKKDKSKEDEHELKFQNFAKSCAVTTILTYALGIGDRHLENIMITD